MWRRWSRKQLSGKEIATLSLSRVEYTIFKVQINYPHPKAWAGG
jgi:hypothetical protein